MKDLIPDDFPIIVIGNKIDKENDRVVSYEEAKEIVDKYTNILFFEMSVKSIINVEEVFHAIINQIDEFKKKNNQPKQKLDKSCTMM